MTDEPKPYNLNISYSEQKKMQIKYSRPESKQDKQLVYFLFLR